MRASLLFPYAEGVKFQQAVVEKLGAGAFSKVYKEPPESSQQVLHPEQYLAGRRPVAVELPPVANRKEWRVLTEGSAGEFDHSILLKQYLGAEEAGKISPAWRGGEVQLLEHRRDQRIVLLYGSEWDTPESARKMFAAYLQVLRAKWKSTVLKEETENVITGTGDDGYFRLSISGTRVTSAEGLASLSQMGTGDS
jgi:hypothetical protein